MRYSWLHGLQTEDEDAVTIWNIAQTEYNNVLVALAQTVKDNEMLLFFVDKDSGAEVIKPFKIWHTLPVLETIKPFESQNLHWLNKDTLVLVSGFHAGYSCLIDYAKKGKSFHAVFKVDIAAKIVTLQRHFVHPVQMC